MFVRLNPARPIPTRPSSAGAFLCGLLILGSAAHSQTTYTVDNWDDGHDVNLSDGVCSAGASFGCTLRAAIEQVGAADPSDGPFVIEVPPDPAGVGQHPLVYNLLEGPIYLSAEMTIRGTGPGPTVVEAASGDVSAGPAILNDAGSGDPIVIENLELRPKGRVAGIFSSGSDLTIRDSVFRPGADGEAVGLSVSMVDGATTICERCQFLGGGSPGVSTEPFTGEGGRLLLIDSTIRDITVTENAEGGGMRLKGGSTLLLRSEVSGNSVSFGSADGGGIYLRNASLTVVNSTISGNSATGEGGGIWVQQGALHLSNATIADNHADSAAGGGGFYASTLGVVQAKNTILSGNTSQPCAGMICLTEGWECAGLGFESLGYNLVFRYNGCPVTQLAGATDLLGGLPNLQPLADLGGHTRVRAVPGNSLVVDRGNPAGCYADVDLDSATAETLLTEDQRGFLRPEDGNLDAVPRCDVGAYEYDCATRGASCQADPGIFTDGFESGDTSAWH